MARGANIAQWPSWTNMFNQEYKIGDWVAYPRAGHSLFIGIVDAIYKEDRLGNPIMREWTDNGDPNLYQIWRDLKYSDPGYQTAYNDWMNSKVTHNDPWAIVMLKPRAYDQEINFGRNRKTIQWPQLVIKVDPPL